jgi:hypothetical protein
MQFWFRYLKEMYQNFVNVHGRQRMRQEDNIKDFRKIRCNMDGSDSLSVQRQRFKPLGYATELLDMLNKSSLQKFCSLLVNSQNKYPYSQLYTKLVAEI